MKQIGIFIGAGMAVFLLTSLLYLCARRWRGRYGKAALIHSVSGLIVVVISAAGAADGGLPNFVFSINYVVWQALFFTADLVRLKGQQAIPDSQ